MSTLKTLLFPKITKNLGGRINFHLRGASKSFFPSADCSVLMDSMLPSSTSTHEYKALSVDYFFYALWCRDENQCKNQSI